MIRDFLPLFAFVFLEGQVSSHISAARHMWLATGLLLVIVESADAPWGSEDRAADTEPADEEPRLGLPT
jgi:hypothetical protein